MKGDGESGCVPAQVGATMGNPGDIIPAMSLLEDDDRDLVYPKGWADRSMAVLTTPSVCCPAADSKRKAATKSKAKKPSYNTFAGIERWIWDIGSGVDICGQEHVPADGSGLVRPETAIVFHTANGAVDAGPMYPGKLLPLAEAIAPYVLESTPPLLSVGKRCMKKGYGFFWLPWKVPFLTTPSGEIFTLEVIDHVP